MTTFSEDQIHRYSRNILLSEVGGKGQEKLLKSSVMVVGAGGLGSPIIAYLAAAGVGTLGICDGDRVDLSNLQRQVLYETADVGLNKAELAARRVRAMNPDVATNVYPAKLSSDSAMHLLADYDVIVDATDNFPARYLLNDACVLLDKPLVHGSVYRFEGQYTSLNVGDGPCYRCIFPQPPAPGSVQSCSEVGVLGVIPGAIGVLQATEVLKLVLDTGKPLAGRLVLYDGLEGDFQQIRVSRNPDCPVCGDHPEITELIDYEAFCGLAEEEEE